MAGMTRMEWARQTIVLQRLARQAVQKAADAHRNARHSGAIAPAQLAELDKAARDAEDALSAHLNVLPAC